MSWIREPCAIQDAVAHRVATKFADARDRCVVDDLIAWVDSLPLQVPQAFPDALHGGHQRWQGAGGERG
eukprot:11997726-Alexandrium_andersonii.AAC.1